MDKPGISHRALSAAVRFWTDSAVYSGKHGEVYTCRQQYGSKAGFVFDNGGGYDLNRAYSRRNIHNQNAHQALGLYRQQVKFQGNNMP